MASTGRDFKHWSGDDYKVDESVVEGIVSFYELDLNTIKGFIKTEIDRESMVIDEGIHETGEYAPGITIGCSYEHDDDGEEVYIYNLFVRGEYVNIGGCGKWYDPFPDSVATQMLSQIDRWKEKI